jgi:hypothetical protein
MFSWLVVSVCLIGSPPDSRSIEITRVTAVRETKADPRKAKVLNRFPGDEEIKRLVSVKGKTAAEVIETLGHPSRMEHPGDGIEVWVYPWPAYCAVGFRNGKVIGTFYTAGY